jgi:cytochrome c-type biogenesis protein CcmH
MTRWLKAVAAMCVVSCALAAPAMCVTPGEMLKDPALEARAREVSQLLRCVVCQNQSIDDSNAPLAQDLRMLVRARLTAGDTNSQAIDFLVARYGNFVLLKPPLQTNTLLLWFGPALMLAAAAYVLRQTLKSRIDAPGVDAAPLSKDDEVRIANLLGQKKAS